MPKIHASSAVACALTALAWAATAAPQDPAPPDKEACASAHEQAQIARKHGRLLEARAHLQLCGAEACPALARDDCRVWAVEVDERVPTIVVFAKDPRGASTTAVRCALDAAPLLARLDGAPVPVNPGAHTLVCETDGAAPVEQPLAVVEGEKGRRVDVTFEPPKIDVPPPKPTASASTTASAPPPPPPPPPRDVPVVAYGLAGLAVVGLGSFAYFGVSGLSDESHLRSTCKTTCNPSDVSAVTTKYHVADASLGVAVVAAGVAGWLYLSRPAPGGPQSGARLGVQAMPGGGAARVEVRF